MMTARRPAYFVYFTSFFLAVCLGLAIRLLPLPGILSQDDMVMNGAPLLTNPDGYYYLRLAREWRDNTYSAEDTRRTARRPDFVPVISVLSAESSRYLSVSLMRAAFWLPPLVVSVAAALLFVLMAGQLGKPWLGVAAAGAGSLPLDWFIRSGPGYFDTDCLIFPLFWAIVLSLYFVSSAGAKKGTCFIFLFLAAFFTWCLHAVWPQAGMPFAGIAWFLFFMVTRFAHRLMKLLRLFLISCALAFVLLIITGYSGSLPSPLNEIGLKIASHFFFVAGTESIFFNPAESVQELISKGFVETIQRFCGWWPVLVCCAIGMIACCVKNMRLSVFIFAPSIFFILFSQFFGIRFLMFSVPLYAIGLAWFSFEVISPLLRRVVHKYSWIPGLVCLIVFCLPAGIQDARASFSSSMNRFSAEMCEKLDKAAPPDAKIWCWWSEGYFVQYFADRWTIIDGGLQNSKRAFTAAFPLAGTSPTLSRHWMKFFAKHPDALNEIAKLCGGDEKAIFFLVDALTSRQQVQKAVRQYGLPNDRNWEKWLYPDEDVYVYLTPDLLLRNSWLSIGLLRHDTEHSVPIYAFPVSESHLDRKDGILKYNNITIKYSYLFFVTNDKLSHDPYREDGPVVIRVKGAEFFFMIGKEYFPALAFQLLFVKPDSVPGFTPIMYTPFLGGVWKIE